MSFASETQGQIREPTSTPRGAHGGPWALRRHLGRVAQACERPDAALGLVLKRLREEREITQEQVAFDAGITVSALSRIERGLNSPGWTTVSHIAGALGVSIVELGGALEQVVGGWAG